MRKTEPPCKQSHFCIINQTTRSTIGDNDFPSWRKFEQRLPLRFGLEFAIEIDLIVVLSKLTNDWVITA